MPLQVFSEIGRLRRVLIHRPGLEIDWMVPSMMERLLFDDILHGDEAREEHDAFRGVLRAAGVETLDPGSLLAETLQDGGARATLLDRLGAEGGVEDEVLAELEPLPAAQLASTLITGIRTPDPATEASRLRAFYRLPPIPNYFFQRDPQTVLGDRVLIASMATEARGREPLLSRIAFEHHPALAGAGVHLSADPTEPSVKPMLEGGDVLVPNDEVVLVGLSERTNRRGIEMLARVLRSSGTSFKHILVVELPARRSYMHLDTVFTFVDHGTCLAYLPVIARDGAEAGPVYRIDLDAPEISYTLCRDLESALDEHDLGVELVPCGGGDSLIDQHREQWTDGANAFAIAPGVIVLYQRNSVTIDLLARRGWRVLSENDVLVEGAEIVGAGPTVVTLVGNELSRARGGPRCMTMPLERERH